LRHLVILLMKYFDAWQLPYSNRQSLLVQRDSVRTNSQPSEIRSSSLSGFLYIAMNLFSVSPRGVKLRVKKTLWCQNWGSNKKCGGQNCTEKFSSDPYFFS